MELIHSRNLGLTIYYLLINFPMFQVEFSNSQTTKYQVIRFSLFLYWVGHL